MSLFNFKAIACGMTLLAIGALQAEDECNYSEDCCVSLVQVGANYTHVDIAVNGDSLKGNLWGVQGLFEYKPLNSIYGGLTVSWKEGKTQDQHELSYVDVQERVGYTYSPCCSDWAVTLFSGFGFRYLEHRFKEYSFRTVKFKYNEFYVPVGLLSEMDFDCWSVGLNCIWMPQVFPTVEIVPVKGAHWNLQDTLGNVLIELPVTYSFEGAYCYSLILKPFYEHWENGRSTAKLSRRNRLGLSKVTYNFWGAEVNFALAF